MSARTDAADMLSAFAAEQAINRNCGLGDAADALGISKKSAAFDLACDALMETPSANKRGVHIPWVEQIAEAEAWIRSGWSSRADWSDPNTDLDR